MASGCVSAVPIWNTDARHHLCLLLLLQRGERNTDSLHGYRSSLVDFDGGTCPTRICCRPEYIPWTFTTGDWRLCSAHSGALCVGPVGLILRWHGHCRNRHQQASFIERPGNTADTKN
eukprot:scaffold14699_cov170-Amphora_coffeaeformis.AAC.9